MSYLDDAVHQIRTGAGPGAAFFEVEQTQHVDPSTSLEAQSYAERYCQQELGYDGPFHSVAQERADDSWAVMLMVEGQ